MLAFFAWNIRLRKLCAISLALAALIVAPMPVHGSRKRVSERYACSSKSFELDDFGSPKAYVSSPDGESRVVLTKDGAFAVMVGIKRLATIHAKQLSCNIEVGWASDSKQFFLSWSGGGAIGEYYVRAFRIDDGRLVELRAPRSAYADFKKHHWCPARTDNIFMLGWTPDSRNLFLVTEVYPTGDCEELGLFRGYLMDAQSGAILRVFREEETDSIKAKSRAAGTVQVPEAASPVNP